MGGFQDDGFVEVPRDRMTIASSGRLENTEALCRQAVLELPMDGAAIVIGGRQDIWQLISATDSVITQLDELQYTLGEGPCIDSYRTRQPVLIPDLEAATAFERWPGFAHEATPVGARAMFAFPLLIGAGAFGVVEFYCRLQGQLEDPDLARALLLVDRIMRVTLDDLGRPGAVDADDEGEVALFGRTQVAQATGMISVQLHTSVADALAQLRARAFTQGRPVGEIADDVIYRRYRFNSDE